MNPKIKKPTALRVVAQPFKHLRTAASFKSGAAQLKGVTSPKIQGTGAANVNRAQVKAACSPVKAVPAAPPAYRPQPVPKVLQKKSRNSPAPPAKQTRDAAAHFRRATAPPPAAPARGTQTGPAKKIVQPAIRGPVTNGVKHGRATIQRSKVGFASIQLMRKGSPTTGPNPSKLEYDSSTDATGAMILVYDRNSVLLLERTFASGGGQHAEEKAIDHLQALVNNGTLAPGPNEPYRVVFCLSKSPCSSTSIPATRTDGNLGCLERLDALRLNGLQNTTGQTVAFHVVLAATKPYQAKGIVGAKAASRDNYDDFGGDGSGSGTFEMLRGY